METIFNEIFRALGYLLGGAFIYSAFVLAEQHAGGENFKKVLWKGFLICAGIALLAGFSLGNPSCIDSEQDLRGTTCYEYADDGYQPTTEQRVAQFAFWFTLLYLPVIFGAYKGKNGLSESQT